MRIRTVAADEFHLVLDVLEKAFPDVSRRFFYTITHQDPWYQEKFCLAAESNNRLTAYIQLFDRRLMMEDRALRFGGIGSVGTHPRYTGKGYASRLLKQAEEVMRNEGMQGGLLFTKIHPFYERLGWKTLPLQEQETRVHGMRNLPRSPTVSKPVREGDYETLHRIYTAEQAFLSGTLQRTLPYWKARARWMDHTCRVIWREDEAIGYFYGAKYRPHLPRIHVTEFGLNVHDTPSANALLQAIRELAVEKRCDTIRMNFQGHPFLSQYMQTTHMEWDTVPYNYMMWKDVGEPGWYDRLYTMARENRMIYWQTDAF